MQRILTFFFQVENILPFFPILNLRFNLNNLNMEDLYSLTFSFLKKL